MLDYSNYQLNLQVCWGPFDPNIIEWARAGMEEPVEKAVERVTAGLKLVAESIEADLTNRTQNMRL